MPLLHSFHLSSSNLSATAISPTSYVSGLYLVFVISASSFSVFISVIDNTLALSHLHLFVVAELLLEFSNISNFIRQLFTFFHPIKGPSEGQANGIYGTFLAPLKSASSKFANCK